MGDKDSRTTYLGKLVFIGEKLGLPSVSRGSTQFPRWAYPFSQTGLPDFRQVCFSDFSEWL